MSLIKVEKVKNTLNDTMNQILRGETTDTGL